MQPFLKLRLACAISTLPTTQAPRRLYYAARAGYVGAIKQLLAHGASATKVPRCGETREEETLFGAS